MILYLAIVEYCSNVSICGSSRFGYIQCMVTTRALSAGEELFSKYDISFNRNGMKDMLKVALDIGHFFSGKSKGDFVDGVKPYLKAASKAADSLNFDALMEVSFDKNNE